MLAGKPSADVQGTEECQELFTILVGVPPEVLAVRRVLPWAQRRLYAPGCLRTVRRQRVARTPEQMFHFATSGSQGVGMRKRRAGLI